MTVTGEHGEIDTINCLFEDEQTVTVSLGQLVTIEAEDMIEGATAYPNNCPRGPSYDATKEMGCVVCVQAEVIYIDGTVTPKFDMDVFKDKF